MEGVLWKKTAPEKEVEHLWGQWKKMKNRRWSVWRRTKSALYKSFLPFFLPFISGEDSFIIVFIFVQYCLFKVAEGIYSFFPPTVSLWIFLLVAASLLLSSAFLFLQGRRTENAVKRADREALSLGLFVFFPIPFVVLLSHLFNIFFAVSVLLFLLVECFFMSYFFVIQSGKASYLRAVAREMWREKTTVFFLPEECRYIPYTMEKKKVFTPLFFKGCVRSPAIPEFIFEPPDIHGVEVGIAGPLKISILPSGIILTDVFREVKINTPDPFRVGEQHAGFVLFRGKEGGVLVFPPKCKIKKREIDETSNIFSFSPLLLRFKKKITSIEASSS